MNSYISINDLIFPLVYGFIIIALFNSYRKSKKAPYYKYFIPGLALKMFGAIALGIIYIFYYGGGDTIWYYLGAKTIHKAFINDPFLGLELIFGEAGNYNIDNGAYTSGIIYFNDPPSYFVVRVAAFFNLFCFNSYFGVALCFATMSFTGVWLIFETIVKLYPVLYKKLSYGILFLPSLIFWGSGIMKDTLCLAALGWFFYAMVQLFIYRKVKIKFVILLIIGFYVLMVVKIYILMTFLPAILIWLGLIYQKQIKNGFARIVIGPILLLIFLAGGFYATQVISAQSQKYSLENIVETTTVTANYLKRISDEGSTYELSNRFDGSLSSLSLLAPEALIVSWFRPFLWEFKNIVMLFSSLENSVLLLLFIISIYKKIHPAYMSYRSIPYSITFFFLFSAIFGIAIGISTINFGSLVRYKIPLLPFFVSGLIILSSRLKKKEMSNLKTFVNNYSNGITHQNG